MKFTIKYIAASILATVVFTGCREESLINVVGEGKMTLSTSVMSDIKVVSRALVDGKNNDLATKTLVWISNSDNKLLYRYEGVINQNQELTLQSGTYFAEGWVGDSIPAFGSWEEGKGKRYHAREQFEIVNGQTTPVKLVCTVRNTLVSLNIDENTSRVLKNISFAVSLNDGITDGSHTVTFDGDNLGGKGYFMANTRTKGFNWTLSGTDIDGKPFTRSGQYNDPDVADEPFIARATEYVFNIRYNATHGDIEIGGVYLDIDVEPEPVEGTTEEVLIALPPEIVGLNGYNISRPILTEPGTVGRKSVHIIASSTLKSVSIEGTLLAALLDNDFYDLLNMGTKYVPYLESKGVNFALFDNHPDATEDNFRPTNLRLNLEEEFTKLLPKGEYTLTITAKDEKNATSTVVDLIFNISEAPGQLTEIDQTDVDFTSATLTAEVTKRGTVMGFEVKSNGTSRAFEDWTFVEGKLSGNNLSAKVSGLSNGTEYAYRLVVDDYKSPEQTFSTKAYPQLPNAGFEDWQMSSSPYLIYKSGGDMFWDSGNHGSATMNKNVTVPDGTVKNSGSYSVKLASQFVGVGALGKFAAGNIFIGQYLNTDGTDGVLGWGRPWETRPKALKLWVKYAPVAVTSDASEYADLKKGDMDNGIIYVALLTDDKITATNSKGNTFGEWPVVVKTKSSGRSLFDKNGSNVIGYGEKVFTEATGENMVQITIPIDYRSDAPVKNIMLVASASKGGDYFVGGNGSTMWLDDLELVYE